MTKENCVLCGKPFSEFGNNPEPLKPYDTGKCCNFCNDTKVIPARMRGLKGF